MKAINIIRQSKAVVLDFDGVIVDSEKWHIEAWKATTEKMKLPIKQPFSIVGFPDEEIALSIAQSESMAKSLLQTKKEIFFELFGGRHPPLVPSVHQFLKIYTESGIMGVTSNSSKSRILKTCEYYGLSQYFKVIEGACGISAPKPSPEIYILVLNKLKMSPGHVVAIEDSIPGLIAAKSAGVKAIGLPTSCPATYLKSEADVVLDSFEALVEEWDNNGMKRDGL